MSVPILHQAGRRGVAILPLSFVVLLHLIMLALWMRDKPVAPDRDAVQRVLSVIWLPEVKSPVAVAPRRARARAAAVRSVRPVTVSAAAAPLPAFAPPLPASAPPRTSPSIDILLQPDEGAAAGAPMAPDTRQLIDMAKRQAGAIDQALRGGKPAPLADTRALPIVRLRSALESAYIDRSRTLVTESYTQADGVVVYRFRQAGKVWCRQSGGAGTSLLEHSEGAKLAGAGSAGGGRTAGHVACPSNDSGWSRLSAGDD